MARIRMEGGNGHARRRSAFDFTVILLPVPSEPNGKARSRRKNRVEVGYQVTVPLLPGIVTYGRTEKEALEMARDAIQCHLDGLLKSGEQIPDERSAHKAKLRIALSA